MRTIFFAMNNSIINALYYDIIQDSNIEYCSYFPDDEKTLMQKYLLTRKAAKVTPFWIKKFFYQRLLRYDFFSKAKKDDEILFIFASVYGMTSDTFFSSFIAFLKNLYPKAKFAFYYEAIVETGNKHLVYLLKEQFDIILSFDKADAKKYDFLFYPSVYSMNPISVDDSIDPFDVFFVGNEKGRFDTLIQYFKLLSDLNKSVVYFISGLKDEYEKRIQAALPQCLIQNNAVHYKESIIYCNQYLPYNRVLSYIDKSRCLFEVLLPNQKGTTMRLSEAVTYGKKIITNCSDALEPPYYQKNNILVYNEKKPISSVEMDRFLTLPYQKSEVNLSPLLMVDFIKNTLYGNQGIHYE